MACHFKALTSIRFLLFYLLLPLNGWGQPDFSSFQIGYNATYYYNDFKQLSVEQYNFNKNPEIVQLPYSYSPLMTGLELGFGEAWEFFGYDINYRMRRLNIEAERTFANGDVDYLKTKIAHNALVIGFNAGLPRFRLGYEIEIGHLKRRDRFTPDEKWDNARKGTLTAAVNLTAQIRFTEEESALGIIIKPYWRMSGFIYKMYYTQFGVNEYFNLQAIGVSAILAINVDR